MITVNQSSLIVSSTVQKGSEQNGTLTENETMRWVLDDVGDEGVTVRLCVTTGSITFFVSQYVSPTKEINDNQSTITSTERLARYCSTIFTKPRQKWGTFTEQNRRRQVESSSLYLAIIGHDTLNTFFLQSGGGNVTFGECLLVTWTESGLNFATSQNIIKLMNFVTRALQFLTFELVNMYKVLYNLGNVQGTLYELLYCACALVNHSV